MTKSSAQYVDTIHSSNDLENVETLINRLVWFAPRERLAGPPPDLQPAPILGPPNFMLRKFDQARLELACDILRGFFNGSRPLELDATNEAPRHGRRLLWFIPTGPR
jgi:hypothetical protein